MTTKHKKFSCDNFAIALSGGGAHGAYQAGILQALNEEGIQFRAISGTSIGAINGLFLAVDRIPEMIEHWKELHPFRLLRIHPLRGFFNSISRSLLSDSLQREILQPYAKIEELRNSGKNLIISTVSVQSAKVFYHRALEMRSDEELLQHILASSAVPGIFPPVELGKEQHVDGGLLSNTPIEPLLDYEPDAIISVSMEPSLYPTKQLNLIRDIFWRALSIFFRNQAERFTAYWEIQSARLRTEHQARRKLKQLLKQANVYQEFPRTAEEIEKLFERLSLFEKDEKIPSIYKIQPSKSLSFRQIDFEHKQVEAALKLGYNDGKEFLKLKKPLLCKETTREH